MNLFQKSIFLIRELGLKQLVPYAAYQIRLRSGLLQRTTPPGGWKSRLELEETDSLQVPFDIVRKEIASKTSRTDLLGQAGEIIQGRFHPFGGPSATLTFDLGVQDLNHWTNYSSTFLGQDIKFVWEPARFTWAYPLLQAAVITEDDCYASAFWRYFEEFSANNPINLGPNWASAQEAALRLLPLMVFWGNLKDLPSTTRERKQDLILFVEQSALRIHSTLDYARSQNNNHLLSESLGLIMAGSFLSGHHPLALSWEQEGFDEFERTILTQVEPDGTYSQHSTNYHRMMLQLALVYYAYAQYSGRKMPDALTQRLAAATRWLLVQVDPGSGRVPNLGHNDGTLLLPFGASGYKDYRPTIQAASMAFLKQPAFPPGQWDELAFALGISYDGCDSHEPIGVIQSPAIDRVGDGKMWGTLRAVQFHSRPAHADQLAVDLWWDGINIAADAGTYLYNAPPPWENAMATTAVHNTVSISGLDQMQREGRFLWLNWISASRIPQRDPQSRSAEILWHSDPPVRHTRTLTYILDDGFTITDTLTPLKPLSELIQANLHWLLPDWTYSVAPGAIVLTHEEHRIELDLSVTPAQDISMADLSLIRAGKALAGDMENPIRGWVSPTYGQREPALSLIQRVLFQREIQVVSRWQLSGSTIKTG